MKKKKKWILLGDKNEIGINRCVERFLGLRMTNSRLLLGSLVYTPLHGVHCIFMPSSVLELNPRVYAKVLRRSFTVSDCIRCNCSSTEGELKILIASFPRSPSFTTL